MSFDKTEQQSFEDLSRAEELSLKKTSPPSEVPGYSVQQFLGSGAYGEVWTGIDQNTGRRVAIKFYTRKSSVDFAMLSREVEKLAQLAADRYVVQLLDVGWDADPPYYVMDHIENGSLEAELEKRGSFTVSEAVEMFQEVAIGLMHLHSRGILHCDLKPGNVLLDQDHKPRLADFGQSRLSHEQTAALGTLFYMAPEQADLDAVPDARWDVYALGALFYTMLTGTPPYRHQDVTDKVDSAVDMGDRLQRYRSAIAAAPAPNAHRKISGVDRGLAEIIDRCIATNPEKRFDSVHSALLALRQREESRARRPLMILGLLGPLALFLVMGLFGTSVYNEAINNTEKSITEKAQESNVWASQFASRSAGEQIDDYFRAVENLANDKEFKKTFEETSDDTTVAHFRARFTNPNHNSNPNSTLVLRKVEDQRKEFIANPQRSKLDQLLALQISDPNVPRSASWFICDEKGVQISAVFDADSISQTIGKNYAYRTYFHGESRDKKTIVDGKTVYHFSLDENDEVPHIKEQHISAVFVSQATNLYKVAFSRPIYIDGKFKGVLACTVNMGDFVDFEVKRNERKDDEADDGEESESKGGILHYATLVDGREGDNQGVILEHPLFTEFRESDNALPKRLNNYRVDFNSLGDKKMFTDPISEDELGEDYKGEWIAAQSNVLRRIKKKDGTSEQVKTGLVVMTMEDAQKVLEPVQNLSTTLLRIGVAAISVLAVVSVCLWYLVMRGMRESSDRVSRAFRSATERSLSSETI